jgi:hypothetical protein
MTNNVLSLSIVTRGAHIDDLEETLIFSLCVISLPNSTRASVVQEEY